MVVSLAANERGTGFVCGHDDGSIIRFFIGEESGAQLSGRIIQHQTTPVALAWANGYIIAAGCDRRIIFYDSQGRQSRLFDYSREEFEKEFTIASGSPNGQAVAIGSFDKIRIFTWSPRQSAWNELATKQIDKLYTVTAMSWRRDGARLVIGSLCGAVIMFESALRRTILQDKFELTFVAPSQVLVKELQESAGENVLIESQIGLEIYDVRIMGKNNYLVARTDESLILCDLTRNLTSEVSWTKSGDHEKFYFENPNVCLIFNAGELSLVEYGDNFILRSVRTEFVNPHTISVRLNERGNTKDNKKLAYLLDMKTICVVDLIKETTIAQIQHNSKVDWLELNETSQKLLFRDKKMRLYLVDVATSGEKQLLLPKALFVQWVIQSDVVVAQTDNNLEIWYNIDMPEHKTLMPVRGEVIDIVRENDKTEVKTRDGASEFTYCLDEGLVEFGTAVNDNDFGRAILFLETLGDVPAAKAMWHNLANVALSQQNILVAQRCFAALGNASKTFYLSETMKIAEKYEETTGPGLQCPEVRVRLALLDADLRTAEMIYLEQGNIEAALQMYKDLRKWDDAIKLADRRGYSDIETLLKEQMSYLLKSNQEEKAGQVLEARGETDQAMTLYLKANRPTKAARLLLKLPHLLHDEELLNRVITLLIKSELYELAGDLSQKMNQPNAAIDYYRKGKVFARAIELARSVSPEEVTTLEEEWGDWLVSRRQADASISHYIEAGATSKALEAAVNAKQWLKAVQIARVLDEPDEIKQFSVELSKQLSQMGNITAAEEILVRAEMYKEAVDLLNSYGQWEKAYDIAEKYLGKNIVRDMFIDMATKLEEEKKLRDAEKVLLTINEPDLAIAMYKRLEHYDSMIRLVEQYHRELVKDTHLHLAQELEARGRYKTAENHYIAGGNWQAAVYMFTNANLWEEAFRVAKQKGVEGASNQVAYMWSRTLPVDGAYKLLSKMGLIEAAITYACKDKIYDFVLELCHMANRPADDIHLKIAQDYEDEGKFTEAEPEYLLANKPKEAILMYTHSRDWRSALRIAEQYLPGAVNEVLLSQAADALESRNYIDYEALLIRAERTDIILQHYKENLMWDDAIRIAKEYNPSSLNELKRLQGQSSRNSGLANDSRQLLQEASDYARNERFRKAIDCLMKINQIPNADPQVVEQALIRAADMCNQFLEGNDAVEVAHQLAPSLLKLNQIPTVAQLYLAAELPKEAVDVFIQAEYWNKARRLAKEIDPQLLAYVENQQKIRLRSDGNIEQLADIDVIAALDLLAEQGQWTRCIEKAKQHNMTIMHKYLAQYAAHLIQNHDIVNALQLYLQYGAPALPQNYNIYLRIALGCFALREADGVHVWKDLRNFLFQLTQSIRAESSDNNDKMRLSYDQLLLIAHYYATRAACREVPSLHQIAVKISIALIRYSDVIPVDKAFFEAGMDLRTLNRECEAFVFLNQYLDICEAIEDASNLVDFSDLHDITDIPESVPIPEKMHLHDEQNVHEEIREWVLAISMDQKINQILPTDDRNLYESRVFDHEQPCVISGYPIQHKQPVIFQRSHRQANRDVWSKLTVSAKMSPHTSIPDTIEFVEKWCGHANFIAY
ncbi:intraflagellar transport protein 172 homolog isoform X2 [Contarinia nasturtii]|nr:intraflagellar transport protein 172 homolog isoform X2 [Contarinia nasturtii]